MTTNPTAPTDYRFYSAPAIRQQPVAKLPASPEKLRRKRKLLRVKGGNHDYCITGEIDVQALRQFQFSYRSMETAFNPAPDGFNQDMAHARKVLPRGKQA